MTDQDQKYTREVILTEFVGFLIEKNRRYGDSALKPVRLFSRLTAIGGLKIRTDDKLSRIDNSDKLRKNDVVDLMGYIGLIIISQDIFGYYEKMVNTAAKITKMAEDVLLFIDKEYFNPNIDIESIPNIQVFSHLNESNDTYNLADYFLSQIQEYDNFYRHHFMSLMYQLIQICDDEHWIDWSDQID